MAFNGRQVDPEFLPDEFLYLRIYSAEGERPSAATMSCYPGSDGMSVNRSKYSEPRDVLWPNHPQLGVARISIQQLAECRCEQEQRKEETRVFTLRPEHDPERGPPENFAHTLVITLDRGNVAKSIGREAKKLMKQALATRFTVEIAPTVDLAPDTEP